MTVQPGSRKSTAAKRHDARAPRPSSSPSFRPVLELCPDHGPASGAGQSLFDSSDDADGEVEAPNLISTLWTPCKCLFNTSRLVEEKLQVEKIHFSISSSDAKPSWTSFMCRRRSFRSAKAALQVETSHLNGFSCRLRWRLSFHLCGKLFGQRAQQKPRRGLSGVGICWLLGKRSKSASKSKPANPLPLFHTC
jgi:hypothetical protein